MRFFFAIVYLFIAFAASAEAQLRIVTDKDTIDFTKVKSGFSRDGTLRITNITDSAVNINHMLIIDQNANANEFQIIVPQPTAFAIDSADGRTAIIRFKPGVLGIRTALLDINTDDGDKFIQLIGEGARIQPDITMQPDFIDFGTLAPGEFKDTTIMIIGGDKDSAAIDWINVVNDNGEIDFDVTPVNQAITFPLIIHNGDTVLLDARYTGMNASGPRTGRTIMEGDVSGSISCEFHGAVGIPDMTFSPQLLDLGIVPQGTSVDTFITIMSTGSSAVKLQRVDAPIQPYSISGLPSFPLSIIGGDSLNIPVHFNAIAPGDYEVPIDAFSKNGALTGINRSALLKAFVIPQVLTKKSPQPFVVSCAIDSIYQRTLTITDTGNFPITISGVTCSDSNFFATYPAILPDTIGIGTIRDILITYKTSSGTVNGNTFCIVKVLTANRAIITDTINVIAQGEQAQFAVTQLSSPSIVANSSTLGIVSISDLAKYKLTSLELDLSITPPDVAEIDTSNVTTDKSIFPNATVTAGYDNTLKKYIAIITSPAELPSSPVIPFLHIPLKYYVAQDQSATVNVSMHSPEKDGCLNFDDQNITITSANECGDQEIRNMLNNIPILSSVAISPNPSHGNHIVISFSSAEHILLSSELVDMNGNKILQRSGDSFEKGRNTLAFNLQSLLSGTYTLHLTAHSANGQMQDVFNSFILTH